jgi:hypothetical protein
LLGESADWVPCYSVEGLTGTEESAGCLTEWEVTESFLTALVLKASSADWAASVDLAALVSASPGIRRQLISYLWPLWAP